MWRTGSLETWTYKQLTTSARGSLVKIHIYFIWQILRYTNALFLFPPSKTAEKTSPIMIPVTQAADMEATVCDEWQIWQWYFVMILVSRSGHAIDTSNKRHGMPTVYYGALTINCRPVDEDKHVEPSRLLEYREQHRFQTPLCLCPLLQTLSEAPTITEAAILQKRSGTHVAEYVAECA